MLARERVDRDARLGEPRRRRPIHPPRHWRKRLTRLLESRSASAGRRRFFWHARRHRFRHASALRNSIRAACASPGHARARRATPRRTAERRTPAAAATRPCETARRGVRRLSPLACLQTGCRERRRRGGLTCEITLPPCKIGPAFAVCLSSSKFRWTGRPTASRKPRNVMLTRRRATTRASPRSGGGPLPTGATPGRRTTTTARPFLWR